MKSSAERFFKEIQGKEVWFVGIGVSHIETIGLFARQGAKVTACDQRDHTQLGDICTKLEQLGVTLLLGKDCPTDFSPADILLRTPGMYYHKPELEAYRKQGGVLTSEMEAFFDLCPCPIVAVTGSDGKTTTTTLIAKMLEAQGQTVHLGGNIGKALLPHILEISPTHIAVVELSSFQLISMRRSPNVAVVTNVTPNHLDVHGSMEEYVQCKRNILSHQNAFSRTILGGDNAISASFAQEVRGDCMTFSLVKPVENGAYLDENQNLVVVRHGGLPQILFPAGDIRIPGIHNVANYLAAICAVWGQVTPENMHKVATQFGGVEHRIEFVRELGGVKWYNDSIATSPTRVVAGLRSFDRKIIVIAGGYDKKIAFEPLAPDIVERVSTLILTGPTADKIEAAVTTHCGYRVGGPTILRAADLPQAVNTAYTIAKEGDIVSLSPACASFDAYPNFEARGRHFKELVHALPE